MLTFLLGLGLLLSSIVQAAEPQRSAVPGKAVSQQRSWTEQWLRAVWSLDLAAKINNWKPKVRVDSDGEGLRLSHPFGNHGPALRLSTSIPERAQLSLRAGGDNRVGSSDYRCAWTLPVPAKALVTRGYLSRQARAPCPQSQPAGEL